mmetsp:Transcript_3870/g.12527  ORF Transcript_3870/g.12527 Transcript_3870/m.12527 type:complete len:329 (+) Transcript_3870:688-1674(+)
MWCALSPFERRGGNASASRHASQGKRCRLWRTTSCHSLCRCLACCHGRLSTRTVHVTVVVAGTPRLCRTRCSRFPLMLHCCSLCERVRRAGSGMCRTTLHPSSLSVPCQRHRRLPTGRRYCSSLCRRLRSSARRQRTPVPHHTRPPSTCSFVATPSWAIPPRLPCRLAMSRTPPMACVACWTSSGTARRRRGSGTEAQPGTATVPTSRRGGCEASCCRDGQGWWCSRSWTTARCVDRSRWQFPWTRPCSPPCQVSRSSLAPSAVASRRRLSSTARRSGQPPTRRRCQRPRRSATCTCGPPLRRRCRCPPRLANRRRSASHCRLASSLR